MTIVLDSTFATPEAVGNELGVPKARVRRLKRLVTFSVGTVGKKLGDKNGTRASASAKKRKHVRAKAKRVAR